MCLCTRCTPKWNGLLFSYRKISFVKLHNPWYFKQGFELYHEFFRLSHDNSLVKYNKHDIICNQWPLRVYLNSCCQRIQHDTGKNHQLCRCHDHCICSEDGRHLRGNEVKLNFKNSWKVSLRLLEQSSKKNPQSHSQSPSVPQIPWPLHFWAASHSTIQRK